MNSLWQSKEYTQSYYSKDFNIEVERANKGYFNSWLITVILADGTVKHTERCDVDQLQHRVRYLKDRMMLNPDALIMNDGQQRKPKRDKRKFKRA